MWSEGFSENVSGLLFGVDLVDPPLIVTRALQDLLKAREIDLMGPTNVPQFGGVTVLYDLDRCLVVFAGLPWTTFATDEEVEEVEHGQHF